MEEKSGCYTLFLSSSYLCEQNRPRYGPYSGLSWIWRRRTCLVENKYRRRASRLRWWRTAKYHLEKNTLGEYASQFRVFNETSFPSSKPPSCLWVSHKRWKQSWLIWTIPRSWRQFSTLGQVPIWFEKTLWQHVSKKRYSQFGPT